MNYSDYFEIQHHPDEVSMDEFIAEAMRTDIRLEEDQKTIDYLNTSRITLKNEVLTCYQFLKEQGLLHAYHEYRPPKGAGKEIM